MTLTEKVASLSLGLIGILTGAAGVLKSSKSYNESRSVIQREEYHKKIGTYILVMLGSGGIAFGGAYYLCYSVDSRHKHLQTP